MAYHEKKLVKTIQNCEIVCENMTSYVKRQCDYQARIRQAELLRDCAAICTLTAKFIARESCFDKCITGVCADICQTCGEECAKFEDKKSQHCSQVCLNCAKECRGFAMKGHKKFCSED